MIGLIGTNIRSELLVIYSLIGLIIALIIVILIIDKVGSKKKTSSIDSKSLSKSFQEIEEQNVEVSSNIKGEDLIVPIENLPVHEEVLDDLDNDDVYVEDEIEKTQAQIEVEEITRLLVEAQKEDRVDPYKQFEEEQELNAIISYEELHEQFDKLYDENEKIQYVDDDKLPIDLEELYQKNEEILNPKKVKLDDLNTIKVEETVKKEISSQANTGFKSSPVISPVYGIQPEYNQSGRNINDNNLDEEIRKTSEFLKSLKELQKNLD